MRFEIIPQVLAVGLAAIGALSDALEGKIYNRIITWGLGLAIAWVAFAGIWAGLGGEIEHSRYPELGRFVTVADQSAGTGDVTTAAVASPDGGPQNGGQPDAWAEEGARLDAPSFWIYLLRFAGNTLIAFAAGFAMWWFGLWAAGDAKLFGMLAALLPLSTYRAGFFPVFPSYVLLFNTFLAVVVILLLELIVRFMRQAFRPNEDEAEAWLRAWTWLRTHVRDILIGFVAIVFVFIVIKTLRMITANAIERYLGITGKVVLFFLLFVLFFPLSKLMQRLWVGIPVVLLTILWIVYVGVFQDLWVIDLPFLRDLHYTITDVFTIGAWAVSLIVFMTLYTLYTNILDFKAVRIWELKPRMILARKTIEILREDQDLVTKKLGELRPDGLTAEQTETLRRWWIDRGKGGRIWMSRTIPFAPALCIGAIATILMSGYIVWV